MSTSVAPDKIREACELIRQHAHPAVHELLGALESCLLRDEALLLMNERTQGLLFDMVDNGPLGELIPLHPGHSVKVGA